MATSYCTSRYATGEEPQIGDVVTVRLEVASAADDEGDILVERGGFRGQVYLPAACVMRFTL